MAKSEPNQTETLTQPLGERGYFETKARVPITESILTQISADAKDIAAQLYEKLGERKELNDEIKKLELRQDEILKDIQTMTHQVDIMAKWFYNWDEDYKRLIGVYEGKEIVINQVDLTSMDRQMKLDDAIHQAEELKKQNEAEPVNPAHYEIPTDDGAPEAEAAE